MNQTGKMSAEPPRIENKRERRRGAAGRAAVLRRAPSDSDCSGETASLSADSGERTARQQLPPLRTGKANRRRGSEWEVLEGLKDGQRFDKRPDVFNGYLHKKRKWPLKGWHKRFFVVDGGILVYARSPADVARGRLHGSVDVGLSVISAKARRRRIDIDADEFIYHLRAKTPEVFRTWLNVLKAHRLYRQHLLTFGARESVPKIHAPNDDLPATDTSSRTSNGNSDFTSNSEEQNKPQSDPNSPSCTDPFIPIRKDESPVIKVEPKSLIPLNSETLKTKDLHLKSDNKLYKTRGSLCSMKCISKKFINRITKKKSLNVSLNSTETEQQIICTDLTSLKSNIPDLKNTSFNGKSPTHEPNAHHINNKKPTTTFYFITNKENNSLDSDSFQIMKRSKKCTNLVKYKNLSDEPPLKQPSSKCLLLGNGNIFPQNVVPSKNPERLTYQRYREQRHMELAKCRKQAVACETSPKEVEEVEVQIGTTVSKLSQNLMTETDYDKLTEDLMLQVFHCGATTDRKEEVRFYIDRVIKDLYEFKADQVKQPVRALFRCLLEYWLKNTSIKEFNNAMTSVKSTNKQSNVYFTRDEKCSGVDLLKVEKETQFRGFYDVIKRNKPKLTTMTPTRAVEKRSSTSNIVRSPKRDTGSFEKERRIQELERLLKNTVYLCDTRRNSMCREKDIKITKKLIDNIDRRSHEFDILPPNENLPLEKSSSSTELPKIQETINNLISDTAIPADVAKLFLGAYLDVLLYDKSSTTTSQSSDWSTQSKKMPTVDVVTEAVIKKVSKSISTNKAPENQNKMQGLNCNVDPGEVYLKDVLENITTIFPNDKSLDECWQNEKKPEPKTKDDKYDNTVKDELGTAVVKSSKMNLIYENCEENCLVIDLSSYNLEHIAMFHDRKSKDMISITIRLKEKPRHHGESAQAHLNLKFSDDQNSRLYDVNKADDWLCLVNDHTPSADIFNKNSSIKNQPSIYAEKELKELKPYLCASDATSKAYHGIYGSSIVDSKTDSLKQTVVDMNDDNQCYLMSIKKGRVASTVQLKRNVKTRENILKSRETSISNTRIEKPEELTVFEKPAPRIIDEKFILLLLENLMLLSKNVPTLYKDINNLHLKLRKKYEKVIKNSCNIQGLSLLGKIYNEDNLKCTENKATQYESNVCTETITIDNRKCIATNTFTLKSDKTITTDIDIQSFISLNKSKEPIQRTLNMKKHNINNFIPSTSKKETIVTETETVSITCVDVAISVQNWTEITKECEIKTLGKYFFENGPSSNCTRITRPIAYFDQIRKRKLPMKFRQQLRDLSLLGSCNKKSTQSQTDNACGGNKRFDKDFNIYQLYLCKKYSLKASSSEINVEYVKNDDVKTLYRCSSGPSFNSGLLSPTSTAMRGPQASFVSGTPGGRLASWIIESGGPLENASRELGQAQLSVQQLQRLLEALELQQQVHHDTDVSLEGASPNVKKDRRKFGLRKKKSNSKCASVELQPPHIDPSSSHTALSALTAPPSPGGGASSVPNSAASLPIACAAARPQSLPGAESLATAPGPASLTSLTPDHQMREDFTVLAKDLVTSLKGIVSTLVCERGRLRAAMEAAEASPGSGMVAALTNNLTTALHQNSELRSRLSRIHDASDIAEICSVGNNSDAVARQFQQSLSYSSSCVSASEFFDAEEHDDDDLKNDDVIPADEAGVIELDGDSSSEAGSLTSEEGSASSDNSDGKASVASAEAITLRAASEPAEGGWARRTRLPAPRPQAGGPSLWNLLYKNIGKDLSQISMPVTINEPLNMLQRLCEELEYCELLDRAAGARCGVERAALVAAFAVSAYAAAAHRAASKPFNPLLAETYECVRDDKGFKFLAEQVSHHPPISACHAESARWCFWQEARIKTKFWGKSMEFQPTGKVHVQLRTTGDHYTWNKVTTCVHNLFGGQRWVDQYGDMHISCVGTDITCKLSFIKASSWSHSRHEVRGAVVSGRGQRLRLAGRWSEALYAGEPPAARCLWRPGAMPPEHEMYYGFTRFAMELNEMEPGMKEILPHTDTRFRPDQRALEEGDVDTAETFKHDLEQAQRERRRDNVHHTPAWFRKTLEDGEETWVFSGEYWKVRENGFPEDIAPRIW